MLAEGTSTVAAARLFELLPDHPILTVASAMEGIGTTKPAATPAIETLMAAGVLVEITGRKRNRRFAYNRYLGLLRGDADGSDYR